MKILITGGCGFIGSHVAARFYKEGHKIYIIDDLSNGDIKNVEVPYKFYNLDIVSNNCEDIFKTNNFDAVIHLSAQADVKTSLESPYIDTKSNLLGITNMLDLSHKYGVKKFIFSSSAAVYGNTETLPITEALGPNPISPYGMSKYAGEFYCKKWMEIYGLKTLCFRFSNVFGPKQGLKGESGVVSIFMDKLVKDQEITIYGDGEQTRDFIYVEDVADAIYKAFESDYTGILNLSTNTENSINDLVHILNDIHPVKKLSYKQSRNGDIKNSRLDNTKVKEALGWCPKFSFAEGIEQTYRWYEKYNAVKKSKDKKTKQRLKSIKENKSLRKLVPYLENVLLFFVIVFMIFVVFKNQYSIINNPIDFCYIYILIMAVMYGMKQAFFAMTASSCIYIYALLNSNIDIITIIYEPSNMLHIAIYMIIGIIVGYAVDVYENKLYINNLEIENIRDKYGFLSMIYNETREIKENLEKQIINSEDSFVSIYNTVKSLESFKVDEIYIEAVKILEKFLKASKISIYSASKDFNYLRLKAKSNTLNFNLPYSVNMNELAQVKTEIINKDIFVNKKFIPQLPMMAAPVINKDKIVGIITVEDLKFENLTLYNENLFKVLVNLISSSITKAYSYDEAIAKDKYLPETEILINREFQNKLRDKIETRKSSGLDFALIKVVNDDYSYKDLYYKIVSRIREDDFIGLGKDNCVYIILSNSDNISAKNAMSRLSSQGIETKLVKEAAENV